jgi:hypothetical protein
VKMPWQRRTKPSPDPSPIPSPVPSPSPSPSPERTSPELLTWANAIDATSLSEKTVKDAERFLQDYRRMTLGARREIALRLRSAIEAQISPPPPATIASMDVIAAAVSARRNQLG